MMILTVLTINFLFFEYEKGFCKVSDLEEIRKHEFILTP